MNTSMKLKKNKNKLMLVSLINGQSQTRPYSIATMARILGVTRQTVHSYLRDFVGTGFMRKREKGYTITSKKLLNEGDCVSLEQWIELGNRYLAEKRDEYREIVGQLSFLTMVDE